MKNNCEKRLEINQYVCDRCGTYWGVNDIDPPICLTEQEVFDHSVDEILESHKPSRKEREEIYKRGATEAREAIKGAQ